MKVEIVSIGTHGAYAVDLVIVGQRFRIRYLSQFRVNPERDARKFVAQLKAAIKADNEVHKSAS